MKKVHIYVKIISITIISLLVGAVFQLIGGLLTGLDFQKYNPQTTNFSQQLVLSFTNFLGIIFSIWLFVKYKFNEKFTALGFKYFSFQDLLLGVLLGATIMSIGFVILLCTNQLQIISIGLNIPKFSYSLLTFVFVAFSEEILVRGFILGNLLKQTNSYKALGTSSIIFAALHIPNPNTSLLSFLNLFLAGLLLGLAFIYTRNLWFSIAMHFSWNFFQGVVFGFYVSGLNSYSIIQQHPLNNNMINGGLFGFEGSILCVVLQTIAILFVYHIHKKKYTVGSEALKNNI